MSNLNHPYESCYYEVNHVYPENDHYHCHDHHHKGVVGVIKDIVKDVLSGGRHYDHHRPTEIIERREEYIIDNSYDQYRNNNHHYHDGPTQIIERREERIIDNSYDPYRRVCVPCHLLISLTAGLERNGLIMRPSI